MIIRSMLDQDVYSLSVAQLVARLHSDVQVEYEFINRGKTQFPPGFGQRLRSEVESMASLRLLDDEYEYLREKCYYLKPNYLDMFRGYRYNPNHVIIRQIGGELFVTVAAPWYCAVYWEVPLLAMISELYYEMTNQPPLIPVAGGDAATWQANLTYKLRKMSNEGCRVAEYGTRRRFSFAVQDEVVAKMKEFSCTLGTSNLLLAKNHDLSAIGTISHQLSMAYACLYGYRQATPQMLKDWVDVYQGELGIALPDTFTFKVFLQSFNSLYSKLFDGLRHDSGDYQWFSMLAIDHYRRLRIDPLSKVIVYSDGLTDDKAIEIHKWAKGHIQTRFGIGTFLSNDVGRPPLNIVIKLSKCAGRPAVKISDSPGKECGLPEAISHCKYDLGIQ
jgi:nicotinate phosphoribosyltransferase